MNDNEPTDNRNVRTLKMVYVNGSEPLIPVGSVRTTFTYDVTGKLQFMWEQNRGDSPDSSDYPFRVTVFPEDANNGD